MKRQLILGLSIGWLSVLGGCKAMVDSSKAGELQANKITVPSLVGHVATEASDMTFINGLAWSPDGAKLASRGDFVRVWDIGGDLLLTIKSNDKFPDDWRAQPLNRFSSVAWSPDGTRLATGGYGGPVRIWDSENGKELHTLQETEILPWPGAWAYVHWSPDGEKLASSMTNSVSDKGVVSTLKIWDATNGKELRTLISQSPSWPWHISWNPDGRKLATIGRGDLRVWDVVTGEEIYKLEVTGGKSSWKDYVCWNPDGTKLAAAIAVSHLDGKGWVTTVKVWDAANGKELYAPKSHIGIDSFLAWSPDGTQLAGCYGNTVKVWDPATGRELRTFETGNVHASHIAVRWRPDGRMLSISESAGEDSLPPKGGVLTVWDIERGLELQRFEYEGGITNAGWNQDGTKFAVSTGDSRGGYSGFEVWAFPQ